jgi:heptosyltransferase-1
MRVLIVKTSSMGDVIHTLPALTDAALHIPGIQFDWVVEENFSEIPAWHPNVNQVIPVAWRRWRKSLLSQSVRQEINAFRKKISEQRYDLVIDAQGLIKSAFIATLAKGKRVGLDWKSARENFASVLYHKRYPVVFEQHAITRARQLFSLALNYAEPTSIPDYGIDRKKLAVTTENEKPYLVFLHGTTWDTKHWPEEYWIELAQVANQNQLQVKLPWGNANERERAERIAASTSDAEVLPKLNLQEIARVLAGAKAVAAVDTGLAHLSAALDVPAVSLYGPTDPARNGALGRSQAHLAVNYPCAPCFSKSCTRQEESIFQLKTIAKCFRTIKPADVWHSLKKMMIF